MLIPQECHKSAFVIDGPLAQVALPMVPTVVKATKKSYHSKHHEEESHKRKRRFRFLFDDSSDLSEEALQEEEQSDGFCSLLSGLAEAY